MKPFNLTVRGNEVEVKPNDEYVEDMTDKQKALCQEFADLFTYGKDPEIFLFETSHGHILMIRLMHVEPRFTPDELRVCLKARHLSMGRDDREHRKGVFEFGIPRDCNL